MTASAHRVRWYVWADARNADGSGGRVLIPRTSTMRGQWGYDVVCSCGWRTRTGGAVRRYIEDEVWLHKRDFTPRSG